MSPSAPERREVGVLGGEGDIGLVIGEFNTDGFCDLRPEFGPEFDCETESRLRITISSSTGTSSSSKSWCFL